MNTNLLLKEFIKDKKVGAVVQTTSYMTRKLIEKINFQQAKVIVEYGSGKGAITKMLLDNMEQNAILFAFEINKNFIKKLTEIQDSRLIVVNNDAAATKTILKNKYQIEVVDYIISTIPFSLIEKHTKNRIINNSFKLLKENGHFITYQYSWHILNLMKRNYNYVNWKLILLNFPPAVIIEGIKNHHNN